MKTIEDGYTGKTRHRIGLFGRLILQVEVVCYYHDWMHHEASPDFNIWRDARNEDLLRLQNQLAHPTGEQKKKGVFKQ